MKRFQFIYFVFLHNFNGAIRVTTKTLRHMASPSLSLSLFLIVVLFLLDGRLSCAKKWKCSRDNKMRKQSALYYDDNESRASFYLIIYLYFLGMLGISFSHFILFSLTFYQKCDFSCFQLSFSIVIGRNKKIGMKMWK